MTVPNSTIWPIKPHTEAKHAILKKYLQAWFPIIDRSFGNQIYFDGFCGPGKYSDGEPGSPIIALNEAVNHTAKLSGSIRFLFNDNRLDRIKYLHTEIGRIIVPKNFNICLENMDFADSLEKLLSNYHPKTHPPTFALIDPYGFKGIPFSLISQLMNRQACECMITFMVESINRFLEHPVEDIRKNITEAFGTDAPVKIALSTEMNRVEQLRDLYKTKLTSIAQYIRYFEMRNQNDSVIYYLFFISNHRSGYIKMKDAMWKVAPNGAFRFSDATDPNQAVLFSSKEQWLPNAIQVIERKYNCAKNVNTKEIREYIEEHTPYLEKHMKAALRKMEEDKGITVMKKKTNGKDRRKPYFPDGVIVDF